MDFLTLAKQRYSERKFDPRPVEQEKLDKILEAGRIAPTAGNYQPQRFYVIRSEEARTKLRRVTLFSFKAPLVIMVCYDDDTVWGNPNDRMFDDYTSGEQDASIAACNMMYTAEDMGIHSLWIRGFDARTAAEVFDLPENIRPVMMLALGYPTEMSKPNKAHFDRKPIEEMVTEL